MAKFRFATVKKSTEGVYVFFSNQREEPDSVHHDSRVHFSNKDYDHPLEEARKFALQWIKPKQGKITVIP